MILSVSLWKTIPVLGLIGQAPCILMVGLPHSLRDDFSLANATAVLWGQSSSTPC